MFNLFTRFRPRSAAAQQRFVRPNLEVLEARDCPAAPQITLTATPLSGHQVQLSGSVTDENPASVMITFKGVASGTTMASSNGTFSYTATASGLGDVQAVGTDQEMLSSNTATATVSSQAPSITLSISYGSGKTVTVSGKVTDESPSGLPVTFTGKVSGTATTGSDGTFTLTTQASGLGDIQATAVDAWGLQSSTASVTVASNAPVISQFTAVHVAGNVWTLQGQVTDEMAMTCEVTFGGLPTLVGKSATPGSDGWFYLTVQLQPGEDGIATAQATDCWGLTSTVAQCLVPHL